MPAIYLTEDDVKALLDMPAAINAVKEAFRRLAAGEAENVPRVRASAPGAVLHTMSAAAEYLGLMCWKCYSTTRGGARFLVGLCDVATGQTMAIIEANLLGQLRTGAATAVAAEHMADPAAGEVGLFGAGAQARTQLAGLAAVRKLKVAYVYCRHEDRRRAFADRMSNELSIDVRPVDRPSEAAEDLPVVITATTSREPVFDGNLLAEGTMVAAIGSNWLSRAEIDRVTLRRADNIVCDSVAACQREAGDMVDALENGDFNWSRAAELSDVVVGRAVARSVSTSIALFKSVGLAIEDLAVAAVVYERATRSGVGTKLPL